MTRVTTQVSFLWIFLIETPRKRDYYKYVTAYRRKYTKTELVEAYCKDWNCNEMAGLCEHTNTRLSSRSADLAMALPADPSETAVSRRRSTIDRSCMALTTRLALVDRVHALPALCPAPRAPSAMCGRSSVGNYTWRAAYPISAARMKVNGENRYYVCTDWRLSVKLPFHSLLRNNWPCRLSVLAILLSPSGQIFGIT
jgi:hypothetical protein